MNHTEHDVLDVIRRYSVKFGAAHLKHDTIAKAIEKSNASASCLQADIVYNTSRKG